MTPLDDVTLARWSSVLSHTPLIQKNVRMTPHNQWSKSSNVYHVLNEMTITLDIERLSSGDTSWMIDYDYSKRFQNGTLRLVNMIGVKEHLFCVDTRRVLDFCHAVRYEFTTYKDDRTSWDRATQMRRWVCLNYGPHGINAAIDPSMSRFFEICLWLGFPIRYSCGGHPQGTYFAMQASFRDHPQYKLFSNLIKTLKWVKDDSDPGTDPPHYLVWRLSCRDELHRAMSFRRLIRKLEQTFDVAMTDIPSPGVYFGQTFVRYDHNYLRDSV